MLSFNLNQPQELGVCVGEIDTQAFGMHTVKVPKEFYAGQEQTFVDAILGKRYHISRILQKPSNVKKFWMQYNCPVTKEHGLT